jgi:Ni/Co efflux regulator RcnB
MFNKLAAVLIAASVVGAPMIATAQPMSTESRTTVKVAKPNKVVVVNKHRAASRHHVKRVKVVSGHRHGRHVTVVKHRKHVRHHHGANKVVVKKVIRTN